MEFVERIKAKAKDNIKTIVLPEAEEERNLKAADIILREGFADLILIGNPDKIHHLASELYLEHIAGAKIVDPMNNPKKQQYVDLMLKLRAAKGLTQEQAEKLIVNPALSGCAHGESRRRRRRGGRGQQSDRRRACVPLSSMSRRCPESAWFPVRSSC